MPDTPAQFLIDDDALVGAEVGTEILLDGEEGRHAARAARIGVGEAVLLTDAAGRQGRAVVVETGKDSLRLRLEEAPAEPLERLPRLALIQALATGGRDEQAVESATELGADRITPWIAERSVSIWRGPKLDKGRQRWAAVARAAVKQCRRAGIPRVDAPISGAALAADVSQRIAEGGIILVLHEQESRPLIGLADELRAAAERGASEVALVVGPEGGISGAELDSLAAAGARTVRLGPEVLRSSTAGPAGIAVLSALLGRWGGTA